jgi:hypothetical protein
MKQHKLRINGKAYKELRRHLFTGDGLEAVAFALCGKLHTKHGDIYCVHETYLYPNEMCTVREVDRVEWSPAEITFLFEKCRKKNLHLLKIHCHPKPWPFFSKTDDSSDKLLSDTVTGWTDRNEDVLSMIMLPDGSLFGRIIDFETNFSDLYSINVIGDDISCYLNSEITKSGEDINIESEVNLRTRQAFGDGTTSIIKSLSIGVVGCSGTGSIVAELLSRLGVGRLVLVDHDNVEYKNLNRIVNSTVDDAAQGRLKVNVLKDAIERMGTGVEVITVADDIHCYNAYEEIAACDIVFGCMDSVDGRHVLNRIATYFCSGFFDIGVRLDADGKGGIRDIFGRVDYIQPGGSSLASRGRYNTEQLKSADMQRTNQDEYKLQIKEGYVKSANVQSPAVISINAMFSSQAVTELLARLHPFRDKPNSDYAAVLFSVSGAVLFTEQDGDPDSELLTKVGLGNVIPALGSPTMITAKLYSHEVSK